MDYPVYDNFWKAFQSRDIPRSTIICGISLPKRFAVVFNLIDKTSAVFMIDGEIYFDEILISASVIYSSSCNI